MYSKVVRAHVVHYIGAHGFGPRRRALPCLINPLYMFVWKAVLYSYVGFISKENENPSLGGYDMVEWV